MSDRPAFELFHAMFPGAPDRGAPAAAATGAAARLAVYFDGLDDVDALMRAEGVTCEVENPNDVIKALKAGAADLIDRFVEQAVVAYFSDPAVARALTGKPVPLFPNHTVMPDIDYDLLEPVLLNCRGYTDE